METFNINLIFLLLCLFLISVDNVHHYALNSITQTNHVSERVLQCAS
jgi:hypothetical protein